jgi:hypothetical protein
VYHMALGNDCTVHTASIDENRSEHSLRIGLVQNYIFVEFLPGNSRPRADLVDHDSYVSNHLFELGRHKLFQLPSLDVENISTHRSVLRYKCVVVDPLLHSRDVVIDTLIDADTVTS